jgi:hypothetical protein
MAPSAASPRRPTSPRPSDPPLPVRTTTRPPSASREKGEGAGADGASGNEGPEPHWLPAIDAATD